MKGGGKLFCNRKTKLPRISRKGDEVSAGSL